MSSSFLFANFSHASTWDVITQKKGILSQDFSGDDKTTWFGIGEIVKNILNAIDFIKNINQHIYQWSIDLLAWIYSTLTNVVLHTPIFLFNNDFVRNTSLIFSVTSVSITIVLTIFESIMRMLRKNHTEFKQILKRFPVVVAISGFAPFLFEKSFQFINKLTKGITELGGNSLTGKTFAQSFSVGSIDVLGLLLFDVILLALMIKILLQNGKRWWDLFVLSAISPLALTSWIFNRHSHLFRQWWNNIKRLSLVQLVYALFVLFIGLFLLGTRFIAPDNYILKLIIILGSLLRLASPPQFILSYTRGEDINDMYDNTKRTGKKIVDTLTLRNIKPINLIKSKITQSKTHKLNRIADLRKKHGRRHVKDLL